MSVAIEEITIVHENWGRVQVKVKYPWLDPAKTLPEIRSRIPIVCDVAMIVVIPAREAKWGMQEISKGIIAILIGLVPVNGRISQTLSSTDREKLRSLLGMQGRLGYSEEVSLVFHNITWNW